MSLANKFVIGALAHVDAGKTSLAESFLYITSTLKNKGRVDHQDAFLDYNNQERLKGITIFNKEARFNYENREYIYVDTPGHDDFRYEANRSLKILDAAILIISALDANYVTTLPLFHSLESLAIPIYIFVNKMDIAYNDEKKILAKLKSDISANCCPYQDIKEQVALQNEELLDYYLTNNDVPKDKLSEALISHNVYPVVFGSALKDEGSDILLKLIHDTTVDKEESDVFNAYVYKISKEKNERLTHLKILSGTLNNKTSFNDEKINEILHYSGKSYENVQQAYQNDLVAVKGLKNVEIGTYLPSFVSDNSTDDNYLTYEIITDISAFKAYNILKELNDEQPELNIHLKDEHLYISLKGELQKEITANILKERFNLNFTYSKPLITYKESLNGAVFGIGHYEPLRHYGEVIIRIEALKRGSGLKFKSLNSSAIGHNLLNYLASYPLTGVLTNSELTDLQITILDLKTSLKHTEGQDLVESLRRAIRQGLLKADNILLEPYYQLRFSQNNTIINEISRAQIDYEIKEDDLFVFLPLNDFNDFILRLKNLLKEQPTYEIVKTYYEQVKNQEQIIQTIAYDPLSDIANPPGSVFCSHGAGHYVSPEEVEENMHLDLSLFIDKEYTAYVHNRSTISDNELSRVWNNTYKPKDSYIPKKTRKTESSEDRIDYELKPLKPLLYLIDGYNLLHAVEAFSNIAEKDLSIAREKTIDMVCDFAAYVDAECILVFDAYLQDAIVSSASVHDNITIVYTRHLQTADMYIEQKSRELKDSYRVNVVTSDRLEQLKVLSESSYRISSREFIERYHNLRKNNQPIEKVPNNRPFAELKKLLEED